MIDRVLDNDIMSIAGCNAKEAVISLTLLGYSEKNAREILRLALERGMLNLGRTMRLVI